jgi:hypothetical protein
MRESANIAAKPYLMVAIATFAKPAVATSTSDMHHSITPVIRHKKYCLDSSQLPHS